MNIHNLSLPHLVREPSRPDAVRPPAVVLMHGVRSNERDLFGLAEYLDDRFLVISARAPLTLGPGAYGWYPVQFTANGPRHEPADAARGRDAARQFLTEATSAYDLDPTRLFLMGFSQGAITSLALALIEPELVAGVVEMSGRLLPEVIPQIAAPEQLKGLPIFAAHGLYDSVLPIENGREIRNKLSKLPVDLTYREYPMAHEVSQESLADITSWLQMRLDDR